MFLCLSIKGVSRARSTVDGSKDPSPSDIKLHTSKSETSLADSDPFVLISDAEVREARSHDTLQALPSISKSTLLPGN